MSRFFCIVSIIIAAFAGAIAPALADDLSIGLTTDMVEVDADFSGARIVLFGAVTGANSIAEAGDIVAIIKGPPLGFKLRPMEKNGLMWTPGDAALIHDAPGLYLTTATRPLEEFTSAQFRKELHLGAAAIDLAGKITPSGAMALNQTAENFIATEKNSGRYNDMAAGVIVQSDSLFSINVDLPPNTPVGDYAVEVFLIRDGALISADTAALAVRKVGIERRIFELAHNQPLGYGVICVAMSLLAGWLGALAFRK